jgi:hypothetical protein
MKAKPLEEKEQTRQLNALELTAQGAGERPEGPFGQAFQLFASAVRFMRKTSACYYPRVYSLCLTKIKISASFTPSRH